MTTAMRQRLFSYGVVVPFAIVLAFVTILMLVFARRAEVT